MEKVKMSVASAPESAIIFGMERPLISFCLLSYNQRRWIGAALEGAFAQTYRPLEIVISDDGSTDGSVEFIQNYIAAHAPADLPVIFNRNQQNIGMFANWMRLAACTHGELLVKADGDDISLPDRTEKVVAAWLADGKRAAAISNAGYRVDLADRSLGSMPAPRVNAPVGALMTWRRDCYAAFPPDVLHPRAGDDMPFAKRALMLGGWLTVPDRLVKYRLGTGNTSPLHQHRKPAIHGWRVWLPSLDQAEHDLDSIADRLSPERVAEFRQTFAAERARAENHLILLESPSFRVRWKAFQQERHTGFGVAAPFMYAYLLPRWIGDWVLDGITRLNQIRRRLRWALFKR